jgi:mannose-1-phosphate guanylyltransferase
VSEASRSRTKALLLAGGLGTRLRPLTDERPKPLVEVCGRPLVVHALQLLKDAGITAVALNSHWLHPLLPRALGATIDVDGASVSLTHTHEPVVLGTGGGLRGLAQALPAAPGERAVIANADALIDLDVRGLLATDDAPLSTLVVKSVPDVAPWGPLGTDGDDRIVTFAGRVAPQGPVARERMFCGWHCVHPRALDVLPGVNVVADVAPDGDTVVTGVESCINKEGYPTWLSRGARLQAFDHAGFFFDVGNAERLWEANRLMLSGELPLRHLTPFARFVVRAPRQFVHPRARVEQGATLVGPCVVDDGAVVEKGAEVGPFGVIGRGVVVKAGVAVRYAAVQSGLERPAVVDVDAVGVIVGDRCRVSIA